MNIIVNGFVNEILRPVIHDYIEVRNISKCYFIDNQIDTPNTDVITNLDYRNLTWGNYDVIWDELIPLDKCLIESLYPCEARVMKMMERIEMHTGRISYEERRAIYYRHLRFWNHVIETEDIKLFLSGIIPHENYDFIIYSICKHKEIDTLLLWQPLPDFLMLMNDWSPFFIELKNSFEKLVSSGADPESIKLSERSQNILDNQMGSGETAVPVYRTSYYFKENRKRVFHSKLRRIFTKLASSTFYNRIFNLKNIRINLYRISGRQIHLLRGKNLRRFYQRISIKPDLNSKFIYLPLHLQPELSTNPLADCFVDQKLIIDILSASVPEDVIIYVKENPIQKIWTRSRDYYRSIHNMPNVSLVDIKADTYDLTNNSLAVATATGTSGWEALFREKPVLMFGHAFFEYAEGVYKCENVLTAKQAIEQIMTDKVKPEISSVKLYLKAMEEVTTAGYYAFHYGPASILDPQENHSTILNYIVSKSAD